MPGALLTPQQQSSLAERIRSHEPSAEEELVRLFSDRVSRSGPRTNARSRELARDLTQEVMLAVVLALRNGHLREAERLAAFVYGTARNVINNYLRTRSRLPREDPIDDELESGATDPTRWKTASASAWCAARSVSSIRPTARILLLTLVEGLKPGEIGARLGLTSEVVRARKSRALKKSDRACEKAVTKMSANATNSSKRTDGLRQGGTGGDPRELPGGQVERGGPRRVRRALFRVRALLR